MSQQQTLCVVCGPSGVGKGTLLNNVKDLFPNTFSVAVSHTTRKPRPDETNGIHYNFTSREEFEKCIKNGDFIEYANVNGNYYGTSIKSIENVQNKNQICILEIDVQGAKIIKDSNKINSNYLFVTTKGGINTLKKRLTGRNTETQQQIEKRLNTAEKELIFLSNNKSFFDCIISNDNLEQSTQTLVKQFTTWYPWINKSSDEIKEDENQSNISIYPIVICGPSGVGKGTLLKRAKELLPNTFGISISNTTRKPRQGEINGIDYNFININEFENGIKNNEYIEYANINGNYYGTSIESIKYQSNKNKICILEIDVQGAKIICDSNKLNANYLFITANGGLNTLKQRLKERNTENEKQIQIRLKTAEKEIKFLNENKQFFDCVISNDNLEESVHKLIQQFKIWYPWIIIDNFDNMNIVNDDEKKTSSSGLIMEKQSFNGLFNVLQFDGVSIYDLRSENEYNKLHVIGAINIANINVLNKMNKLINKRIFVYDSNGIMNNENKIKCKKLYDIICKLNGIQFCVIRDGFDVFHKIYPFLCIDNNNKINKENIIKYPNCITDTNNRIYVGGEMHAFNGDIITNLGITHIVNTKGTESKLDDSIQKTLKYINIKIDDSINESVINYFNKSNEFINNALNENNINKILIHCGGGKSRSTTFTMAYLIKYKKQSLAYAYGIVSNDRPKAFPNDAFLNDLSKYEIKLYGKTTKHFI
eukprot:124509_1